MDAPGIVGNRGMAATHGDGVCAAGSHGPTSTSVRISGQPRLMTRRAHYPRRHASSIQRPAISVELILAPLSPAHSNALVSARDDRSRPPLRPRTGRASPGSESYSPNPRLLALAFGMAGLGWAYWPNLQYLYTIWDNEPNYSHGILVIPIALVIFFSGWRT